MSLSSPNKFRGSLNQKLLMQRNNKYRLAFRQLIEGVNHTNGPMSPRHRESFFNQFDPNIVDTIIQTKNYQMLEPFMEGLLKCEYQSSNSQLNKLINNFRNISNYLIDVQFSVENENINLESEIKKLKAQMQ
jgi:hypothetical protein